MNRRWQAIACAFALALATGFGAEATSAATITYQVNDHPHGSLNCRNAPAGQKECYALRLEHRHTFTANAPGTGLFFQYTEGETTANIFGVVQHNQGGGFYEIFTTLGGILLTDGGTTDWFGPNASGLTYDDMLADLKDKSDATEFNKDDFDDELDRIYFSTIDLTMAVAPGSPHTFRKRLRYDEFPNAPNPKRFFIQKNHRTNDNVLAAAGWLERAYNKGRYGTNDFLFTLSKTPVPPGTPVSEPAAGLIFAVGLGTLAILAQRRRRARVTR